MARSESWKDNFAKFLGLSSKDSGLGQNSVAPDSTVTASKSVYEERGLDFSNPGSGFGSGWGKV